MPEGLEAEIWRRDAEALVGRTISHVWFDDRVAPPDLADVLIGSRVEAVRRLGKVVLIDTDGATVGLHFGMTGRVEVDGTSSIERLEYASGADRAEWDRLRIRTDGADRVALRMNDPRRLGRVSLDPDLSHLGPDAVMLTTAELTAGVAGRRAAIKTLLLDQAVVAGLGNLCADEVLFHAGVTPARAADELSSPEFEAIASSCRERLAEMLTAGGSTHGVLSPAVRRALGACPIDDGELRRASLGGRTAVWCERHQR